MSTDKGAADYSIWSFCYAKGQVPRDFIEGAPVGSNQGLLQIPMLYSAIVAPPSAARRSALLVDTGFTAARSMTGRTFADVETPAEILTKVELEPHDVQTILLTHMHFDHAGGIDSFPDATILLQRSEYEGWKRALKTLPNQAPSKSSWVLSSTNLDDVERLDRALADGRLTLIDGDREVWPGITLRLAADTHTFGSQWIEVSTPAGPYVIAGDAVVSFANLERMWPPGYHQGNAWKLLDAYASIKQAVGGDWARRVVPGHDMELFRRFPSAIFAGNPLAEVHLAAGQRSFLPAS